ncbi:MAG: DUF4974 domain-containing protein [Bacteroidetes bacterium]|nr:DUF4974 domain-containing protein [Bacteroidota bacterium]
MKNHRSIKKLTDAEIARYFANELEQNEVKAIEDWINSDDVNKKNIQKLKNVWDAAGKLREMELMDVEKARKKVVKKSHGFGGRRNVLFYWEKIAAVLFIPLLLSVLFYLYVAKPVQKNQDIYNEINIAFGTTSKLLLADGTKVWLNSGSYLKYPLKLAEGIREIYLEGEAYFEVAENKSNPFIVRTPDLDIIATGTSFNVLAYPEEDMVETTLIEGKVSLVKKFTNSKIKMLTELKPGERASFEKNEKKVVLGMVDTDKVISWKEGQLIFRNDPLDEIVKRLSRWYNTDIELVVEELRSYRYTATFTEETLHQVLELLKISAPIEYSYSSRLKLTDNSFTKRKVKIRLKQ